MSTIDPTESRRQEAARHLGHPSASAKSLGFYVLGFGFAAVLGASISLSFWSVTSQSDLMDRSADFGFVEMGGPALLFVGFLGPFFLACGSGWEQKFRGEMRGSGRAGFLGMLGVTIGATFAILVWWRGPVILGQSPGFLSDDPPEPWGFWGWFAYTGRWWIPALLAVITVLTWFGWMNSAGRARAEADRRDQLLTSGTRTTGVVTAVRILYHTNEHGQKSVVGAIVTIKFTDASGTNRWVERHTKDASSVIIGARADILYDHTDPGNESSIFVSLVPSPTPSEWLATRQPSAWAEAFKLRVS